MTVITRVPGTPDPSLRPAIPDFGMELSHLWRPGSFRGATWFDEVGNMDLSQSSGVSGGTRGTVSKLTDNGVPYLRSSAADRFVAATPEVVPANLRTVFAVVCFDEGDAVVGAPYVVNTGTAGLMVDASGVGSSVPSGFATKFEVGVWHVVGFVLPASGAASVLANGAVTVISAVGPANAFRLLGANAGAARRARVAIAGASPEVLTGTDLTDVVVPNVRSWLRGLEFA